MGSPLEVCEKAWGRFWAPRAFEIWREVVIWRWWEAWRGASRVRSLGPGADLGMRRLGFSSQEGLLSVSLCLLPGLSFPIFTMPGNGWVRVRKYLDNLSHFPQPCDFYGASPPPPPWMAPPPSLPDRRRAGLPCITSSVPLALSFALLVLLAFQH